MDRAHHYWESEISTQPSTPYTSHTPSPTLARYLVSHLGATRPPPPTVWWFDRHTSSSHLPCQCACHPQRGAARRPTPRTAVASPAARAERTRRRGPPTMRSLLA